MAPTTRERILEVTSELFIEQGYDATSLRQIAERLGFTKAALYYHFRNKDDLLAALMAPADELIAHLLDRLEATRSVADWGEVLEWMVGAFLDHLDLFKLMERNRVAISHLDGWVDEPRHREMHARVEAAARAASDDLREQIRMVAALSALTGFDDWGPDLIHETPPEILRTELLGAARAMLGLAPIPG